MSAPAVAAARTARIPRSARRSPAPGGERIAVALFAALALLCAAIPYARALSHQTADQVFSGLVGGVDDNNVYLGLMRQASEGAWLFVNNFTPEPSRPAMLNLLYQLLGRFSRLTGL